MEGCRLEARGLVAAAGGRPVLRAGDFSVGPGEYACVWGRSGSGKTSLLATLALLRRPHEGEVVVCGEPGWRLGEAARARLRARLIAYIPQEPLLVSSLTVEENAALAALAAGADPSRVPRLLEALGIARLAGRRPGELSGGEARRASIAAALAKPAPVVLADEPTAALDDDNARRVVGLLHERARRGGLVVHAAPYIEDYVPCTRVYEIRRGRLEPA